MACARACLLLLLLLVELVGHCYPRAYELFPALVEPGAVGRSSHKLSQVSAHWSTSLGTTWLDATMHPPATLHLRSAPLPAARHLTKPAKLTLPPRCTVHRHIPRLSAPHHKTGAPHAVRSPPRVISRGACPVHTFLVRLWSNGRAESDFALGRANQPRIELQACACTVRIVQPTWQRVNAFIPLLSSNFTLRGLPSTSILGHHTGMQLSSSAQHLPWACDESPPRASPAHPSVAGAQTPMEASLPPSSRAGKESAKLLPIFLQALVQASGWLGCDVCTMS